MEINESVRVTCNGIEFDLISWSGHFNGMFGTWCSAVCVGNPDDFWTDSSFCSVIAWMEGYSAAYRDN